MTDRFDPPKKIYIDESRMQNAGRGVFASEKIPAGTLIEACPVISLDGSKARKRLRKTELVNYYFLWGNDRIHTALCLGWGSIYNHSFSPNARYEKVTDEERMDFYTLRDIKAGEEITVNYNGDPNDTRRLRIPGIPASAGGPTPSATPRFVRGAIRRLRLIKDWISGNAHALLIFADAPIF